MAISPEQPRGPEETVAMASGVVRSATSPGMQDEGRFVSGALLGGRYRILNLLGKGGMGEVYRATDLTLGQSVALKFLPIEAAANPHLLERFHGEVRVARQVSHPNVCRVYDIGEAEGLPYISMEYVDGDDLGALLQRIGRLPAEKAIEISRKLCAGLAAAHSKGVIHRDLKPQNIMLNKRGEVLIMDFGLAAIADQLSGSEARNGTPAYMSPEQLKGIEVTAKSDIYSLGLILFELFTGKRPFEAKSVAHLIAAQESSSLTGMTTLVGDLDPSVERVVKACLHPDPAKRPLSPLSVAAALPGGDPLAAALAAGETPSPDLVAAGGRAEGLNKWWGILSLAVIGACLVFAPIFKQQMIAINHVPLEFTPEVLEQKARDIAASFGYAEPPRDRYVRLMGRPNLGQVLIGRPGAKNWRELLRGEAPVMAWYRESPNWLVAKPRGTSIQRENPPPLTPGMVEIEIDAYGRLREFEATPRLGAFAKPATEEMVFGSMGLDKSQFAEIAPTNLPLSAFDQHKAYRGKHPQIPEMQLEVDIASYKGQIVHADLVGPWNRQDAPAARHSGFEVAQEAMRWITSLGGLLFAPLLARRNWKQGRADRKGALRVAIALFIFGVGYWASIVHLPPTREIVSLGSQAIADSLLDGAMLWVLYLALEPALRARWPHSIVTWNRVLKGNFTDPLVASHVLIGVATGSAIWAIFAARQWMASEAFGLSFGGFSEITYGTRNVIAMLFNRSQESLGFGLLGFFCLFGLRTLVRRDWIAAALGAGLFPLIENGVSSSGPNPWASYALYVVVYAILLMIMLKLGVLATMSTMMFLYVIGASPMGTNWTTWYAPNGLVMIAVVVATAGWSFYYSLGNQDLLGGREEGSAL